MQTAESSPLQITELFFSYWSNNRIDDALAMLTDDVLYQNVPFPDIIGRHSVGEFHRKFGVGTDFLLDWKIAHIAASGNVVLNERIDIFRHRDGGKITLPVMGIIEVKNGQISLWRDYFDPADFDKQLSKIREA